MNTPPAPATPQSEPGDSEHFSSIQKYETWSADITETIARVKRSFYFNNPTRYRRVPKAVLLGDLGDPPQSSILSPRSWWWYWNTRFNFPTLIKSHRLLLERKLALINKYMDSAPPEVLALMKVDQKCIEQIFSIMEKARAKLRDKFPSYPLEHETPPHDGSIYVHMLIVMWIGILLPPILVEPWGLSPIYNFLPQMVVPGLSEMAAISQSPDSILLFLSTCFYWVILWALMRYYYPTLPMIYNRKSVIADLYIMMPVALVTIGLLYFAPLPWFSLFYDAKLSALILFGGLYVSLNTGECLGITAFLIKNRSTDIQPERMYHGK